MDKTRWINNGGHFILLELLWPAAVLGAAAGLTWPAALVLLAMLGWTAVRGLGLRQDLRLVVSGLVIGAVFELLLIGGGLIDYRLQPGPGWPPMWIFLLWAGFSLNLRHCMRWFQRHPLAGSLFGLLGAPFSVLAGVALGAATAPAGNMALALAYGLGWAITMPLLSWLTLRFEPDHPAMVKRHDSPVVA